jgi:hypothetical protein
MRRLRGPLPLVHIHTICSAGDLSMEVVETPGTPLATPAAAKDDEHAALQQKLLQSLQVGPCARMHSIEFPAPTTFCCFCSHAAYVALKTFSGQRTILQGHCVLPLCAHRIPGYLLGLMRTFNSAMRACPPCQKGETARSPKRTSPSSSYKNRNVVLGTTEI